MFELFAANPDLDRVVHLGAQAGVRWSLQAPFAYSAANVTGQLAILEAVRRAEAIAGHAYTLDYAEVERSLPAIDEAVAPSPVVGGGEFVTAFSDRPEVQAAQTFLSSPEFATAKASLGTWVSANSGVRRAWPSSRRAAARTSSKSGMRVMSSAAPVRAA